MRAVLFEESRINKHVNVLTNIQISTKKASWLVASWPTSGPLISSRW